MLGDWNKIYFGVIISCMEMLLLILPSFSHYPSIRGLEDIPIKSIDNRAD